jgi:hypothetical protein
MAASSKTSKNENGGKYLNASVILAFFNCLCQVTLPALNRSRLERWKINHREMPFRKCIGRSRPLKRDFAKARKPWPSLAEKMPK